MKHTDYKKRDHCKYCGSTENLTIDHKNPVCLGGGDTKDNLQTLCEECNKLKSGIPDVVFRRIMYHGIYCMLNNKKRAYKFWK